MTSFIFLFTGIVLMIVGAIVSQMRGTVIVQHQLANQATSHLAHYAVGGGLAGLGLVFVLIGLLSRMRGAQQAKQIQTLMQTGVDAEGTVTFVDKNYLMLVNNRPIYSIVEYTYTDGAGNQHTRKVDNISSDLVIRRQVQVGGKVAIKYSAQNPAESIIVL